LEARKSATWFHRHHWFAASHIEPKTSRRLALTVTCRAVSMHPLRRPDAS
jgi:hypothetical protein